MDNERIKEVIEQVFHNPQVSPPAISYKITDFGGEIGEYTSEYIDVGDFNSYVKRLEAQLIRRLTSN